MRLVVVAIFVGFNRVVVRRVADYVKNFVSAVYQSFSALVCA